MGTLHTVNKSPFTDQALKSCLSLCAPGDSLLLIEDGTYGALTAAPTAKLLDDVTKRGIKVYALASDLAARGLDSQLAAGIVLTDYQGFVRLSCEHETIQSWY